MKYAKKKPITHKIITSSFHKYNVVNKESRFYDGIQFDSRFEMLRYRELRLLEGMGEISELRLQVPFQLLDDFISGDGKKIRGVKYISDFVYIDKSGREVVEDVKGYLTPEYKLKKKFFLHRYPNLKFIETRDKKYFNIGELINRKRG